MTLLSRFTAAAAAMTFLIAPALAQTETTPAPTMPPQSPGAQPGMSGQSSDSMREMMRDMMREMMQEEPRAYGRRGDRAERRGGDRWRHGAWRDRHGSEYRMDRGPRGMRSGMMHGAGMRMMFAIVDADGDGALSLAEVQDFHGRIFNAVDENGDGNVEMEEIESFFHGSDDKDDE
ncbi:EF-hand domain-containing protein [Mesorhizobium sp. WSM2239]|uniref:EF-hand domain-containing protein n=2 Tax=unclassified Mesorhizobium TaxID=325217 RepID=A0AAU8D207_9HYPH